MIDKTRGLIWYRIIQSLSLLWILVNFAMTLIGPVIPGLSIEDVNLSFPLYASYYRAVRLAIMCSSIALFIKMKAYDADVLKVWVVISGIIFANIIIEPMLLHMAYSIELTSEIFASYLGQAVSSAIWIIPTFIYLEKRCTPYKHPRVKIDSLSPVHASTIHPTTEINSAKEYTLSDFTVISFCRFCGNALGENSKYCDSCGKKVR